MGSKDGTGDLTVIKIKGIGTVIKGLNSVFSDARNRSLKGDELANFLISGVKKFNKISTKDEDSLKEALPIKFSKFLKGETTEENPGKRVNIKILGGCCPNCFELEKQAMEAVIDLEINGEFLHLRDPELISKYGIVPTPALVINEKVVSSGRVVMKEEIKRMILKVLNE